MGHDHDHDHEHEHNHHHSPDEYLSDKALVDKIYSMLEDENLDGAVEHMLTLGSDEDVARAWIAVQCDINNLEHDPYASAELALEGVEFCLEKGFKIGAAMLLHNISAFFMPSFDEDVDEEMIPLILDSARRQLELRKETAQDEALMWAMWDLGLAELVAGNVDEAISMLEDGARMAREMESPTGEAWCQLFIGKAKIRNIPEKKNEGISDMKSAADHINRNGEDWEKEATQFLLDTVDISM